MNKSSSPSSLSPLPPPPVDTFASGHSSINQAVHNGESNRSNTLTLYKFNDNMYFGSRCDGPSCSACDCFRSETTVSNKSSVSVCPSMCSLDDCECEPHLHTDRMHTQIISERLTRFQVLQTYASIKYLLMITILVSIADGLFILSYQQSFMRDLQFSLFRRKQRLSTDFSRFIVFDEQRLRVATGSLYLINVFIQLIGLFGVNSDRLSITSSYAIYSIGCFVFTIGTYLPHQRLLISLCINCCLAVLSTIFAIFIKKFKHIQFGNKSISI